MCAIGKISNWYFICKNDASVREKLTMAHWIRISLLCVSGFPKKHITSQASKTNQNLVCFWLLENVLLRFRLQLYIWVICSFVLF